VPGLFILTMIDDTPWSHHGSASVLGPGRWLKAYTALEPERRYARVGTRPSTGVASSGCGVISIGSAVGLPSASHSARDRRDRSLTVARLFVGPLTPPSHPALLFAAWILGAAYSHISERDAVRDPALLDVTPVRTMGLTPRVRDAYLEARRGHRPPWAHVVRNPEEPCDWEAWRALLEGCDLGEVPISNLVMDAAAAGALLSSARRPGKHFLAHLQGVVPAPGRPWQLLDFTRSGQPATADAGVYARVAAGKKPKPIEPQYLVLARRGAEYLYGGTLEPRRCGRVFPVDEVLAACTRAALLEGAAVVPVVSGVAASEARFVLVGFTGDEPSAAFDAARQARCAELRRLVAAALGAELVPDRIELFPLYARRIDSKIDGKVDLEWSGAQYLGGLLFRKARAPIFQRLVALRRSMRATAAAAPEAEATWP